MNPPKPNDRISEYVLIESIGSGTFGQVFKARHHVWPDQLVAIKIPTDPDYVRVLRREGIVAHKIDHANVVKVLGFDPFADPPYLIMEYVSGGDLRRLLAHGPLPVDRAVALLEQVLEGLSAAHAAGIIHLDIKPSNILLTAEGSAKLTDFGLGRGLMLTEESIVQSMSLAAEARSITGTLEYMSPEQRRPDPDRPIDHRADLYSVGVVLFEMLTGDRPAGGEKPSDLREGVPDWLDRLFTNSYARLQWRYESAQAMLADLREGRARPVAPPPIARAVPVARPAGPAAPARPVRPPGQALRCSGCHQPVLPEDQFCIHCGLQVATEVRRCARCGGYPQLHDKFCVLCGTAL